MENVKVWKEQVVIPTYEAGEPDQNPMFLEKRVYQGSSGKVYPHSVIDKIHDEKTDKAYQAVFLENKYLKIMVLPELGGRIQRATDKTNGYDFVYYNHVIKPALVGLAGPWISGGIEFNWPQHHRPSTYDPVDYRFAENKDGSCTVWVSEIENMFRTKGMAGFTLYPDKAYLEISAKIYNRTNVPQTFLWWANPAIPVNDYTQSVFPPDVHAVMDHGKRAVSNFPIATGTYYKMDYSQGVDISRYKNIPVPTSYMAYHSDYDFVGGYDYRENAGILHIADHHISPGKKQWTWGCGEFGKAWDCNLTDEDGPYIELMTGCFTDNQPDFTWLAPYEEKVFTQYFMPYKTVGMIKNAVLDAAIGLELEDGKVKVTAYATRELRDAVFTASVNGETIFCKALTLTPEHTMEEYFAVTDSISESDIKIQLFDDSGKEIVSYQAAEKKIEPVPDPASEVPMPEDTASIEDLFLYGMHLEQYRHATFEPADYYEEGLRRDPTDSRINNAYGRLLMQRGRFEQSETYLTNAVSKLLRSNPNPYDGEPLYNLGLALKYQGKMQEAYDRFYKATWNGAWQDSGFYQLACMDCINSDFEKALYHIERSLVRNCHNMKARNLKTAILRTLGRFELAREVIRETQKIDPLDFNSVNEEIFLLRAENRENEAKAAEETLTVLMHGDHNSYLELAIDYIEAGFYDEAAAVLKQYTAQKDPAGVYPMVYYYLAYAEHWKGARGQTETYLQLADSACSDLCFPHRLEDILVLELAKALCPTLPKAYYYLGCLWYDKKQYDLAIENWEASRDLDSSFPTAHRNLALAYYNKLGDAENAVTELETAYHLNPDDARVLLELDQLYKKTGRGFAERLSFLEEHRGAVLKRDDLYLEYVSLHNAEGHYETAIELLNSRQFHPWEGGEGKVPAQYILAHVELAKQALTGNDYGKAIGLLAPLCGSYPLNFGEGKLDGAQENNIYYFLGCAYEGAGESEQAKACFLKASTGLSEPAGMMYYNDQPPEMIFYQGAALLKLGKRDAAFSRFNKLIDYGKAHIFDDVHIDYFAVSLPDLLIFDEDLNQRNQVHCNFMIALGYLGKGDQKSADQFFRDASALDNSHIGAILHSRLKL